MDNDFKDIPLADSNVTLKLADIQKRCSQLLLDPAEFDALTLEEPVDSAERNNPYNLG